MGPLVTGASGLHLHIDMKAPRLRATEKGRESMGAMRTATVPLVSKGLACNAVMKITQVTKTPWSSASAWLTRSRILVIQW